MPRKSFPRLTSKALRILGACDNEFLSSQEVAIRAGMEGEGLTAWVGAHDREVRAQWRGKTKKDSYWALADLAEQGDAFTASLVDLGYVDLSKEGKRVLIRITPLGREALQALQISHPAQIFEGTDDGTSLSDGATFAGEMQGELHSLGDRSTLGGAEGSSVADFFRVGDGAEHQMEIGDLSQRYRIEKSLGHGGMGEVLLAVDSRLDRRVAIKRIRSDKAAGKTATARFSQEAKAIASLSHPNIVAVHDYGRDSQGPFLIMEYVSGGSLLQRCKQGKIEFDDAINLVCQLCDGLGHAHDAGIIHRDIKPANILLTDSGIPKLTDFGLAKADARDHTMTMDGAVLGTLDFMPPEQRMNAALTDCRSDLWSLAASFYQMITGDSPKVINLDHVPRKVRGVLAKALQSDIESRFASALEMREALANAKFSLKSFATPPVSLEVGECIICSTENPLEKKYCRECGARLIANCLSCDEAINVWDKACGQCGSKQDTLIEKKTNAFLKDMEEATLLRQDLKFTDALSKLEDSLLTDDPRFINATHAAKEFATSVEREQAELEATASKRLEAAQRFYANRMYSEANAEIQKIPEAFRKGTAVELVNSISKIQAEVNQLLNELRSEETEVAFAKMMPKVARLEELTSVTDEIDGFREAILDTIERHQRLRVEIATDAKQAYEAYHFEEVLEVISRAPESLIDEWEEISAVRKVSRDQLTEIEDLKKRIGELEGNQPIDYENLLALTRKLCDLMPNDTGLGKNLNALVARVNQVHTEDRTLMDQAATHSRNHEYQKALSCYAKLQSKLFCERAHGPRVAAQEAKDQVLELDKMIMASLTVADWVSTKNLLGQYLQLAPANSFYLELTEEIEILIEAASIEATDLHRADELLNRISLPVLCSHRDSMRSRINYKIKEKEDLHKRIMSFDYLSNKQARLDLIARYLAIDSQNDEMRELAESLAKRSAGEVEAKKRVVASKSRSWVSLIGLSLTCVIVLWAILIQIKGGVESSNSNVAATYNAEDEGVSSSRASIPSTDISEGEVAEQRESESIPGKPLPNLRGGTAASSRRNLTSPTEDDTLDNLLVELREDDYLTDGNDQASNHPVTGEVLRFPFREWIDNTGSFRTSASFLRVAGGQVLLLKSNGVEISVEYHKLSNTDQIYVESISPPASLGQHSVVTNSIGMRLNLISEGTFLMGEGDTAHQVTLTKPFLLGVHEVTQGNYELLMESNPSQFKDFDNPFQYGDHPVEQVTWDDAMEFCRRLSALPEERSAGRVYRLPTEAEWEYACRAGTTTKYGFGNFSGYLNEYAWYGRQLRWSDTPSSPEETERLGPIRYARECVGVVQRLV